jgi:hypothetical protein
VHADHFEIGAEDSEEHVFIDLGAELEEGLDGVVSVLGVRQLYYVQLNKVDDGVDFRGVDVSDELLELSGTVFFVDSEAQLGGWDCGDLLASDAEAMGEGFFYKGSSGLLLW